MDDSALAQCIKAVPPGRWGIGVSGGADSVALLLLMHGRPDVQLHVVHLDHETRAGESAIDADFVAELAAKLNIPCTIQRRTTVESSFGKILKNTSSRFRRARFAFFAQVVKAQSLQGILLAHHADDQIENILMCMLRGSHPQNIRGMRFKSTVQQLQILRPLLNINSAGLREFLQQNDQPWREDSSNQSDQYQRNRVRHWLAQQQNLKTSLLAVASSSQNVKKWLTSHAPPLGETFHVDELNALSLPLANQCAARWLLERGVPSNLISEKVTGRLIQMATDAAAPARQHFPGRLLVRRRKGLIAVEIKINSVELPASS